MAFSLSRNAKLYVSTAQVVGNMTGDNTWEVPILDGFSFSAETATQEIQISEAGSTPARGQRVFTTAVEPVTWSISQYMRPRYTAVTPLQVDAIERVLWAGLQAPGTSTAPTKYTQPGAGITQQLSTDASGGMIVDFSQSNTNELLQLSFVFDLGGVWYHINGVVVDTVEADFSIDSIATLNWTGYGLSITRIVDPNWTGNALNSGVTTGNYILAPTASDGLGCIRNKLSTVDITGNNTPYNNTYSVALTGGSISINNNITFLTPESLGVVNRPCGHYTGTRQVSGTMTAYLKTATNETADLLEDLLAYADLNDPDPTDFALKINVGGASPSAPWNNRALVQFDLPHAHLVIPQINIEDVVTVDIPFNGLPTLTSGVYDEGATNELTVRYFADET